MALFSDQAVVLRHIDYSETSQVLVMFTLENGKQRMIAKGTKRSTRKQFSPGIDLLEVGRVVWSARGTGGGLVTLTEWHQQMAAHGLRQSLAALYSALYAAEITAELTQDGDPHPAAHQSLVTLLRRLADAEPAPPAVVVYQRQLLHDIGLFPELGACVVCGQADPTTEPLYFSSREGGLVCRDCEGPHVEKRRVPLAVVRAALAPVPPSASAGGAFDLLNYHVAHLAGRMPRTAKCLGETFGSVRLADGE